MRHSREAQQLMLDGSLTLSRVEENGICVDRNALDRSIAKCDRVIRRSEEKIRALPEFQTWRQRFGQKTNIGSRDQLAKVLFNDLGYTTDERTESGEREKTDESVLSSLGCEMADLFLEARKYEKCRNTFLLGTKNETIWSEGGRGIVRPVFNLHFVLSHRSSCDTPNLQNQPIRDPVLAKLIRTIYRAREGRRLVEIDYGGIEVKTAAFYNHDPVLIEYINDPTKDMHRDMAAQCYNIEPDAVSKMARYCGKNRFVFPQFYGDWYESCARALWDSIDEFELLYGEIPMKGHLEDSKNIHNLADFTEHIKEVEEDFWGRRFRVYQEWKDDWWESYQQTGLFQTLTGFILEGIFDRKQVINLPIQGTAFHLLLWSLIRLQRWIDRHKMKTLIVCQVHDSMLLDIPEDEFDDVIEEAVKIMTIDASNHFQFVNVPLEVEAEASPVDGTWYEKETIAL